jgi:hypothetical protein
LPPAEEWLTQLRGTPGLWRDYVPIAWHVDYWDHLGWKDPFASKAATAREYAYASSWGSRSVYTPCFVMDGLERRPQGIPAGPGASVGVLRAVYAHDKLQVRFTPAGTAAVQHDTSGAETYEAHVVLVALGVTSKVTAGENRGRALRHDFIAATPVASAILRSGRAELEVSPPKPSASTTLALVVWITRPGELVPVQATGGVLPPQA